MAEPAKIPVEKISIRVRTLLREARRLESHGATDQAEAKYREAASIDPSDTQAIKRLSEYSKRRVTNDLAKDEEASSAEPTRFGPLDGPHIERVVIDSEPPQPNPARFVVNGARISKEIKLLDENRERLDPCADSLIAKKLQYTWDTFFGRFEGLRTIQREAIPRILLGEDGILISPTSSGKTEAVIAPLVERMMREKWDSLSILYIGPTKALLDDIGMKFRLWLRDFSRTVAIRHSESKEQYDVDLLVTTPEGADSLFSWDERPFENLRAVIIDECHALDGSYRGDQVRILLSRLRGTSPNKLNVYLVSATVANPEQMARRYCVDPFVARGKGGRGIKYDLVPEVTDVLEIIKQEGLKKVLFFCNRPSGVETLAFNEAISSLPEGSIRVHHAQLSPEIRKEAEVFLRTAPEVYCLSSPTLEVGIDIGDIDAAVLADRPRSRAQLVQRIGRAGRRSEMVRVIAVYDGDADRIYLEAVLDSVAYNDQAALPYSFDPSVIAQQILAITRYRPMPLGYILQMLSGFIPTPDLHHIIDNMRAIGYIEARDDNILITKKGEDLGPGIFSNIPSGTNHALVIEQRTNRPIGKVGLPVDSVFVLSRAVWKIVDRKNDAVIVERIPGRTGKIPPFIVHEQKGRHFNLLPAEIQIRDASKQRADEGRTSVTSSLVPAEASNLQASPSRVGPLLMDKTKTPLISISAASQDKQAASQSSQSGSTIENGIAAFAHAKSKLGDPPIDSIIVDGSNVACNETKKGTASALQLILAYNQLISNYGFQNVKILIGAGLRHKMAENDFYSLMDFFDHENEKRGKKILYQTPARESDDCFIIDFAVDKDYLILTNDLYRDHISQNPEERHDIERRLVRYLFIDNELRIAKFPEYTA